jgi:hypothetical protein
MSQFLKTCSASLVLAVASLAAHGADAPQAAPAPEADTPVNGNADAQVAVRDAATGHLRAPTASESQTLHAEGAKLRRAIRPTMQKTHSSGAHGVRLNEEFMNYSVVIKQPDGRLVEYCFSGPEAADAAAAAPASATNPLPTE